MLMLSFRITLRNWGNNSVIFWRDRGFGIYTVFLIGLNPSSPESITHCGIDSQVVLNVKSTRGEAAAAWMFVSLESGKR